jgi:polynucleotide 5'-hydroxyl-kinase GRC3/NOL9
MLSAFAARKAAQAVQSQSLAAPTKDEDGVATTGGDEDSEDEEESSSREQSPEFIVDKPASSVESNARLNGKSDAAANPKKRKLKQQKTRNSSAAKKQKKTRYFQEPGSSTNLASSGTAVGQELDGDVIMLPSSEEEDMGEGGISSDSEEDEDEGEQEQAQTLAETTEKKKRKQKQKHKRRWSPSAPYVDADPDGEHDASGDEADDVNDTIPVPPVSQPLSTFRPIPSQNIFSLTEEEVISLLSPPPASASTSTSSSSGPGTLLLPIPGETISLLGTYTLTVLSGSVSILGTILSASLKTYRVFAPRSSPIPVIEPTTELGKPLVVDLGGNGQSDDGANGVKEELRRRLKEAFCVILIRELKTGVEGLGDVCRVFEGVFKPKGLRHQIRWKAAAGDLMNGVDGTEVDDISGLSGVWLVCRSLLLLFSILRIFQLTSPDSSLQPFALPPTWSQAFADFLPSSSITAATDDQPSSSLNGRGKGKGKEKGIYLVRGAKKSGKSTFARTVVNRLLLRFVGSFNLVTFLGVFCSYYNIFYEQIQKSRIPRV